MFDFIFSTEKITKNHIKNKENLDFIDTILSYLLSDKMSEKNIDNIIKNCPLPKQYEQQFNLVSKIFEGDKKYINSIYLKILYKLIKDNYIKIEQAEKYSLDYEGMVLIINGGLLNKEINIKRKEVIQSLIWKITLWAFIINLMFQFYNSFIKSH